MFKKILFSTTGTSLCDAAARVAFDMANRYGAKLFIIHIFGIPDRSYSQAAIDIKTGEKVDLNSDHFQKVQEEIKQTYSEQIKHNKECEFEILAGIPGTEILRTARKKDIDLIIMGARHSKKEKKSPQQKLIVGSTLQSVARSARCPVLIIGRTAASFWGGISNILFGTDFSKASDSAFLFAYKLARTLKCTLNFFHVINISEDSPGNVMDQNEIDDRIREARAKIREKYLSRMEGFDDYEIDVWEGIPYVEIVKYAREKFADLIIMAHHSKKIDPEKANIGTTMEQIALRSNCPVISVNHTDKI